jgi:cytochrome c-type biogenesis protein CcmE
MKKTHIFLLIIIAAGIAIILSTAGDASQYVGFQEAKELAEAGNDKLLHVVGELPKDEHGNILGMDESEKLRFSFDLVDANNEKGRVIYLEPKPTDFERAEKVVVVGKMVGGNFKADKILMKCPSKYVETEISEAS